MKNQEHDKASFEMNMISEEKPPIFDLEYLTNKEVFHRFSEESDKEFLNRIKEERNIIIDNEKGQLIDIDGRCIYEIESIETDTVTVDKSTELKEAKLKLQTSKEESKKIIRFIPRAPQNPYTNEEHLSLDITETKEAIKLLQMQLEDLEKQAIQEIQYGKEIPGYKLKSEFSRTNWSIKPEEVIEMGLSIGLALRKPQKTEVITPLQAIKLAKKDEEAITKIKSLCKSEFKGYKLVSNDENQEEDINFEDL